MCSLPAEMASQAELEQCGRNYSEVHTEGRLSNPQGVFLVSPAPRFPPSLGFPAFQFQTQSQFPPLNPGRPGLRPAARADAAPAPVFSSVAFRPLAEPAFCGRSRG